MSLIAKYDGKMNITGKLIKEYRLKKNLSYEKLAIKLELMGIIIHKQSLYDIENNKRTVKDYELIAIANILDINLNEIMKSL